MTELVAAALIHVCKSTNKKTKTKKFKKKKKRCEAIFDSYYQGNHGKRFKRAKIMEKDRERIRAVDVLSDIETGRCSSKKEHSLVFISIHQISG